MNSYDERIKRVCEYIAYNLDKELTLEQLSDVAALSKYHFHRIFFAYTGLNLLKFVQLERLKRASYQMALKNDVRIIDVALDAQFNSPEAFSRAFKREFGQTPSEFIKKPEWPKWHSKFKFLYPGKDKIMDVKIIDFKHVKIAFLEHHGSPDSVPESVFQFKSWRIETGLSPVKTSNTYGIPHNDPNEVASEDFRFDICGSIEYDVPDNSSGIKTGNIPAGRCAVVRHVGSLSNIAASVYYLYKEWLPQSGEELRNFPIFFEYLNLDPTVDECDLQTNVHLPIL